MVKDRMGVCVVVVGLTGSNSNSNSIAIPITWPVFAGLFSHGPQEQPSQVQHTVAGIDIDDDDRFLNHISSF